ncbi:hypothetical protein V865_005640 [Kwoniella europaea PYCC6329]|uniref:G-protein coupled receptors family 1 profile domain-containing protein n=1 Tax=Kwoniella europaea PYCC6329 TaxID=1423913 RepID=A0AAX4KNI5_9TREE
MSYFISSISRRAHHVDLDIGRIALADQVTRSDDDVWVSIVNVVILCLTILGSGMILVSMFVLERIRGRPGTTRTRIVQALIVSDFLLGIVGLISSCLFLAGDGSAIAHGTVSCDGLGFLLTAILWTEHGWTLILAFATFMILIYPLHWFTLWMEQRWYLLWAFVWVVSIAVAILGYELFGFYPSGGTCFYGANAGLYSELMQFIPRCVVCIAITVLYARLYVFLKRPDKIRLPGSNSATGGPYETVSSTSNKDKGEFRERFGSLITNGPFRRKRGSSGEVLSVLPEGQSNVSSSSSTDPPPVIQEKEKEKEKEPTRKNSGFRRPSFSPTKEVPPWEKLELPAFQVDGQRFGGPSPSSIHSGSIWNGWRSGRKRSSTTTISTNVHSPSSRLNSISNSVKHQREETNLRSTPPGLYVPRMPSIPSEDHIDPRNPNRNQDTTQTHPQHKRESTDDTYIAQSSIVSGSALTGAGEKKRKKSVQLPSSPKSTISSIEYGHGPGQSPKIDSRQRPSITISEGIELTPGEFQVADQARQDGSEARQMRSSVQPLPKITLPPRSDNPWSTLGSGVGGRRSAPTTPTFSQQNFQFTTRSGPGTPGAPGTPGTIAPQSSRRTSKNDRDRTDTQGDDAEENEEDEDEWDLARMLAQPPPGSHTADDRFAPRQSTTNNDESFELVPESMSSYLNRKTALLMLWFPLGYLFLFSVSLIRLIYDFAGNPPVGLRAISKWMILAQGVLDAIIYGVVEWHTKRVVRKKVRKGTFSPRNAAGGGTPVGSKSGFNGLLKNIGSRVAGTASAGGGGGTQSKIDSNSGGGQEMKNLSRSQTSSFHEQPQSQSKNLHTSTGIGTEWNQEFSMGSIREGIPTSSNGIPMLEEQIHAIRVDDERRGSESPLGGAISPKL